VQHRHHLSASALALAITALLLVGGAPASAAPPLSEIRLPAEFALPNDVAAGPDGAGWASDGSLGGIWRVPTKGKPAFVDFPTASQPAAIIAAGEYLWVADAGRDEIVRLNVDGGAERFPIPTQDAAPSSVAAGPDGAIWFTEGRGDKIGRLAADGSVTEYPLSVRGAFASNITVGPDLSLWFVEQGADRVGRITTAGVLTEFALPQGTLPGPIVAAPDGALWLAARNTNAIMRLTTAGVITATFPLATADADPVGLAIGTDGALWIAQHGADSIARMTLDGAITRERALRFGAPDSLQLAPDGSLWFAEGIPARIGRLEP
jgi:virginiamycin B lyase